VLLALRLSRWGLLSVVSLMHWLQAPEECRFQQMLELTVLSAVALAA
jgi:hypothetical protein